MRHFRAPSFGWPYRIALFAPLLPFAGLALIQVFAALGVGPAILGSMLFAWAVGPVAVALLATLIALPVGITRLWMRPDERTGLNLSSLAVGVLLLLAAASFGWASTLMLTSNAT